MTAASSIIVAPSAHGSPPPPPPAVSAAVILKEKVPPPSYAPTSTKYVPVAGQVHSIYESTLSVSRSSSSFSTITVSPSVSSSFMVVSSSVPRSVSSWYDWPASASNENMMAASVAASMEPSTALPSVGTCSKSGAGTGAGAVGVGAGAGAGGGGPVVTPAPSPHTYEASKPPAPTDSSL